MIAKLTPTTETPGRDTMKIRGKKTSLRKTLDFLSHRTTLTLGAGTVGPTLMLAIAESVSGPEAVITEAAASLVTGAATWSGLSNKWPGPVKAAAFTSFVYAGSAAAATVTSSATASLVAWLASSAASVGARFYYLHATTEARIKSRLVDAKVTVEESKAQREQMKIKTESLKQEQLRLKIEAEVRASLPPAHHGLPYTPVFRGDETAYESQLLSVLTPGRWADLAPERGLDGTAVVTSQLTDAGIVAMIRLDGRWDTPKLKAATDQIRALASIRSETRVTVETGVTGDQARVTVVTRSATDGMSLDWSPSHQGIGLDEVTGEVVSVPLKPGLHILIGGVTGTGKSVSWRPLAMQAFHRDDWDVIVVDPKRQEAIGWGHAVLTVGQQPDREERMAAIYALVQRLTREMHRRQAEAKGATWVPDGRPENRFLLVVIDEGAAIVRLSQDKDFRDVLTLLEELWSEARSVGMQFVWATQNPTKSGGVPALVKDNMSVRISLTVGAGEHERSMFGENAQQTGWTPSILGGQPGRAMVQYGPRKPNPVDLWYVTDDMVAKLPEGPGFSSPAMNGSARPQTAASGPVRMEAGPERDRVIREHLEANPKASYRDVVKALNVPLAAVQRARKGE